MTLKEAIRILLADGGWKDALGTLFLAADIALIWAMMYAIGG